MGRDASLIVCYDEELFLRGMKQDDVDAEASADIGQINMKEKVHDVMDIFKGKAHEAAETIRWQAGEVREGLRARRSSIDQALLPPIPEEPILVPSPSVIRHPIVSLAPVSLEQEPEFTFLSNDLLPKPIPAVPILTDVEPHGTSSQEKSNSPFVERIFEAQILLEKSAHNVRLKIDGALVKRFGARAEKIQREIERTRLTAVGAAARFAEFLQAQLRKYITELRVPLVVVSGQLPETRRPSVIEHNAEFEIPLKPQGKRLSERVNAQTVRVAKLFEQEFGNVALTLREQQRGMLPA